MVRQSRQSHPSPVDNKGAPSVETGDACALTIRHVEHPSKRSATRKASVRSSPRAPASVAFLDTADVVIRASASTVSAAGVLASASATRRSSRSCPRWRVTLPADAHHTAAACAGLGQAGRRARRHRRQMVGAAPTWDLHGLTQALEAGSIEPQLPGAPGSFTSSGRPGSRRMKRSAGLRAAGSRTEALRPTASSASPARSSEASPLVLDQPGSEGGSGSRGQPLVSARRAGPWCSLRAPGATRCFKRDGVTRGLARGATGQEV